ncbi:polyketide synthase, partial [Streptomyces sp. JHD 1]|nr:polyketide synthase [Streptomyces sp. JHD 1]
MSVLSSWRRDQRQRSLIDQWRYHVTWKPVSPQPATPLSGRWLLLTPPTGAQEVAQWCEDGLRTAGAQVERTSTLPGDLSGVTGIVSLLALEDAPLERGVAPGLTGNLALAQELGRSDGSARVWCLTRGAVSTGPSDPLTHPAQAQTWGLGRVIALEHPTRWGGLIDLPRTLDARAWQRTAALLSVDAGEDQVAVRSTGIHARRVVRAPQAPATPVRLRGTVLITGGTGGLG